jgi:transcriptional regulator with XRE-family HTH domain
MALFFDSEWFDARLATSGLKRSDLAVALGLSESEIGEVWKDQREIGAAQVRVMAALLGVPPQDVAKHAGVSTPVPRADEEDRLARIERELQEIKLLLAELRERR